MTTSIDREGTPQNGRFVLRVDGRQAGELTFLSDGPGVIVADHTFVEPALRGKGHAHRLVDALVQWARAEKLTIVPSCWYVREILSADPDLKALIAG